MEPDAYRLMAQIEDRHWWFRARRRILRALIARLGLPAGAAILEAGCGSGGNSAMLRGFGALDRFEPDAEALALARARDGQPAETGALPGPIPFGGRAYDLILLSDVLEHVEDDAGALAALHERLKPGGRLLLTVPAFPCLWSAHDTRHHHFRRYRRAPLAGLLRQAGFEVAMLSYYNFLLFPAVALVRLWHGLTGGGAADEALPGPALNRLLEALFASERHLLGRLPLPFGVSLIGIARRP